MERSRIDLVADILRDCRKPMTSAEVGSALGYRRPECIEIARPHLNRLVDASLVVKTPSRHLGYGKGKTPCLYQWVDDATDSALAKLRRD